MSQLDPRPYDVEQNPYAAPEVDLESSVTAPVGALAEAEAIRRAHLSREASIKAVGTLSILGGAVLLLVLPFVIMTVLSNKAEGTADTIAAVVRRMTVYVLICALGIAVGIGLRRLQPWARWVESVLLGIQILACLVQLGLRPAIAAMSFPQATIAALFLSLCVGRKASMVFSPRYKEVIALTPHIRYRMTPWVKYLLLGFLGLIIFLVVMGIVAAIFSR